MKRHQIWSVAVLAIALFATAGFFAVRLALAYRAEASAARDAAFVERLAREKEEANARDHAQIWTGGKHYRQSENGWVRVP